MKEITASDFAMHLLVSTESVSRYIKLFIKPKYRAKF